MIVCSLHQASGSFTAGVFLVTNIIELSYKEYYYYSRIDGMLVHHRVLLQHYFASTCLNIEVQCMTSWLVHLPLDQAVRVQTLPRDIVLCSRVRHFTLTVLSPPGCINEYQQILMLGLTL